jgi:hypothetical protein
MLLSVGSDVRMALDNVFPILNTAVTSEVLGVEIPIVGSALKNTDIASSIAKLKANLDSNPFDSETDITKIAGDLQTALGAPYTVTATKDTPNTGDTKFTIHRADALATINTGSFQFNVGLPGLDLQTSGTGLTIQLGDQFNLNFVVPKPGPQPGSIYFVATGGGNHDFSLAANLSVPNFSATGTLAHLLQIKLEEDKADNAGNDTGLPSQGATSFNPTFNLDLPAGHLSPSDVANSKASLTGQAKVNLGMLVSFGGSTQFPSFKTNFHLDWTLDTTDTTQTIGSKPTVQFKSVEVDAGSYIGQFLGPILQKIQTVTRPLQPLIDVLETPVPVISDLLGHKETFLDMVSLLTNSSGGDTVSFIKSVAQIVDLVNSIPTDPGLKDIIIPFGDFNLGMLTDVRNIAPGDLKNLDLNSLSNSNFFSTLFGNLQAAGGLSSTVADFLKKSEGGDSGSFQASFPIIDNPINVFGLFLGKPVDLFDLTLPDLKFGGEFDQFFPVLGPLGVELKGSVGADFHLQVGYDTTGLASGDPFQGFFVSDDSSATITAGIHAYAALDVVVFSAGVGGGIDATIKFTPNDPDGDGRLRPQEIIDDLKMGPFCLFNTEGKITAGLDAFVKVGFDTPFGFTGWSKDYTIAQTTLLDYSSGCMTGVDANPQPTLGHLSTGMGADAGIPTGYLVLNMGPFAGDRGVGDTSDGNETFAVSHLGGAANDESLQIDGMGSTSGPFKHVKGIYAEGGNGNNIITVKAGVLSPVTLYGGFNNALHPGPHNPPGQNQLYSADGPANLYAGDGGDHIVAGSGDANIYGGAGDDNLVGGTGHCYIKAGSGHSNLRGGGGVSTLDGNNGASDIETAGSGDDHLIGGTGGDNTYIIDNPNNTILASIGAGIVITGSGAQNQLIITGKGDPGFAETYNYGPGNGDGTIATTNGTVSQMISYEGAGPIFDSLGAGSTALNATGGADTINIGDATSSFQVNSDSSPKGNNLDVSIDSFAQTLLDNKTTVNVYGRGGGDTATIDSHHGADGLTNLNLFLGSGTNIANVRATPGGVTTTADGSAAGATDSFIVSSDAGVNSPPGGTVAGIGGPLTVVGGPGSDNRLIVGNTTGAGGSTVLLISSLIHGFGGAADISYGTAAGGGFTHSLANDGILILGSSLGGDTFNVQSTLGGSTTKIIGGGADVFNVSSDAGVNSPPTGTVSGIAGTLTVVGGPAVGNRLIVGNLAGAPSSNAIITSSSIHGFGGAADIFYGTAQGGAFTDPAANDGILIRGSAAGGDTFDVQSTLANSTIYIEGHGVQDSFTVSSDAGVNSPPLGYVSGIAGTLTVLGGSGAGNRLIVSNFGGNTSHQAFFTSNSIHYVGSAAYMYYSTAPGGSFTDGAANDGILMRGSVVGGDVFDIQSTLAGSTTKFEGHGSLTSFIVSSDAGTVVQPAGTVSGIAGLLTVVGGNGGSNRLIVSNVAGPGNSTVLVTSGKIHGLGQAVDILYGTAPGGSFTDGPANDGILVRGSAAGGDTFNVQSTLAGSSTTLEGHGASATFNVSSDAGVNNPVAGNLGGIAGTLALVGGSGPLNRLTVSNLAGAGGSTAVLTANSVHGLGGAADILYSAPAGGGFTDGTANDGILIRGSSQGGETYNIRGTLGGSTTKVTGAGSDTFAVSSDAGLNMPSSGSLTGIAGTLTLAAGSGTANRLIVSNVGSPGGNTVLLTSSQIHGFGLAADIFYSTATGGAFTDGAANDGIYLRGASAGGDTFAVRSTLGRSTTKIEGRGSQDTFLVSSDAGLTSPPAGNLGGIAGTLAVVGGAGPLNRLIVSNYAGGRSTNALVSASTIHAFGGAADITYATAPGGSFTDGTANDGILIRGSSGGGDTFTVQGTLAGSSTKIIGYGGNDVFNVQATAGPLTVVTGTGVSGNTINVGSLAPATGGTLKNIQGALTVTGAGSDTLKVDDTGSTVARSGTLTPTTLTGLGMGTGGITYNGLSVLNVNLGSGGNTFAINDINPSTRTSISGGSSSNDRLTARFAQDFTGRLDLTGFEHATITVVRNFKGTLTDTAPGHIELLTVGGALTGTLVAGTIDRKTVGS